MNSNSISNNCQASSTELLDLINSAFTEHSDFKLVSLDRLESQINTESDRIRFDSSPLTESALLGGSPPPSNRGGKPQNPRPVSISIDWESGTFPIERLAEVKAILKRFFPLCEEWKHDEPCCPQPAKGYTHRWGLKNGPSIHYSVGGTYVFREIDGTERVVSEKPPRPEAWVVTTGQPLRSLSFEDQCSLLTALMAYGMKPTRLDLAVDDRTGRFTPETFLRWIEAGYLTGFRKVNVIQEYSNFGTERGVTIYLGRRGKDGSGKFLRIYDKRAEQNKHLSDREYEELCKHELPWLRIELELSGDKVVAVADHLFSQIMRSAKAAMQSIKSFVLTQFFSFMIGRKERAKSERTVVPEWQEYIEGCEAVDLQYPQKVKPEGMNVEAFQNQWGGHLANEFSKNPLECLRLFSATMLNGYQRGYGLEWLKQRCGDVDPAFLIYKLLNGFDNLVTNLEASLTQVTVT